MPDRKIYTPPLNKFQIVEEELADIFKYAYDIKDQYDEGLITGSEFVRDKCGPFFIKLNNVKRKLDVFDDNKKVDVLSKLATLESEFLSTLSRKK